MSEFLGIPTVLTVLRSDNPEAVALAVGAASADNIELAIIKATTEAFQTRNWARTLLQTNAGRRFRSDFSDFGAFEDHILYHTSHANATCASFLYESKVTRDISEVPSLEGRTHVERIRSASARIAARGEKVYFTDITPPDIAQGGLHVACVFSPGLCRLNVGQGARFLSNSRLRKAPVEAGILKSAKPLNQMNPFPHPFP